MAITIHHGPNGSYKSSSVIQDFFIPAALQARTVVTNIRGVSTERTYENLPETPEGFQVIHVDTTTKEGRERIRRWFHWAPHGALLLFDEPSVCFPKSLTAADLRKLDNPEAEDKDEPVTFQQAFEMHRHWNWDIVISTPNIKSVRSEIRDTTEGAYKHRNNAILGLKGSFNEVFHKAENDGKSPSDWLSEPRRRKIKPIVWKLYDSTKTGKHQDTTTGTNIFKNGKILFLMAILLATGGFSTYNMVSNKTVKSEPAQAAVPVPVQANNTQASTVPDRNPSDIDINKPNSIAPYSRYQMTISGSASRDELTKYIIRAKTAETDIILTSDQLLSVGYTLIAESECALTIVYKTSRTNLYC